MLDLGRFWDRLETNFPLGGPRRHLRETVLGAELADGLERAGILALRRVADTYPCPRPGGADCPRTVHPAEGGGYLALCGNVPADCRPIALTAEDIALLAVDPARLCRSLAAALSVHPKVDAVSGIADTFRIGTFIPEPGLRYPIFFMARTRAPSYVEALDALQSRQTDGGYAVLVPTERFLPDDAAQRLADRGVPVLVLSNVVGLADGCLTTAVDPIRYLGGIGGRSPAGPHAAAGQIVARALVREAGKPPGWLDLHQRQLDDLRGAAGRYDVFADQPNRTVAKKGGTIVRDVALSSFQSIRAALTKRGHFDATMEGPDLVSSKQIFQRARAIFDIKTGRSSWRIFPSIRTDEGHAVYSFTPDATVSFAFVFLPED